MEGDGVKILTHCFTPSSTVAQISIEQKLPLDEQYTLYSAMLEALILFVDEDAKLAELVLEATGMSITN